MKISVVFITNGKKPDILNTCIQSAKFADEIIVVGNVDSIDDNNVIKIEAKDLCDRGLISKMRNIGAESSSGDLIINVDDDIFFPPMFKKKLLKFVGLNPKLQSFNTKVVGINGCRYWDRAIHHSNGDSVMIDYNETHPDLYYSGAFIIRKKELANCHKWDDNLGYYQKEDLEYSKRLKKNGYNINIDSKNYVVHMDSAYILYINGENKLVCDKGIDPKVAVIEGKEFREIKCIIK